MTDNERQIIWDEFLQLWPREKIESMTLPQYTSLASPECFITCLESGTQELGSIWGGSAFKFGIYRQANPEGKQSDSKHTYGSEYAWRTALGSEPNEVFEKVKQEIRRIIDAIRNGDLTAIKSKILWPVVAGKIAYLYQNRDQPVLVGVFKPEVLKSFLGITETGAMEMADLYSRVMAKRGNKNLVTFSREVWEAGAQGFNMPSSLFSSPSAHGKTAIPLNQILYGPPGTGKTYNAVDKALEIFRAAGWDTGQKGRSECYKELRDSRHIRFVTFHQSFSYEEFVEGIRANVEDGAIQYEVVNGIFREICEDAQRQVQRKSTGKLDLAGRTVWKMSLGNTTRDEDSWVYQYCKTNNCLLMGYGGDVNFSACGSWQNIKATFEQELPEQIKESTYAVTQMDNFVLQMKPGDLVIISEGNKNFRAVGVIGGNYRVIDNGHDADTYRQCRDVEWLYFCDPAQDVKDIYERNFSQQTLYEMEGTAIKWSALSKLLDSSQKEDSLPYVLIIDEINRGNIAAIFGELITLVEESHRANGSESLSLTLPYSKDTFSIPGNVYLIGTMNTADRSLTQIDAALRRRFSWEYMPPRPDLLQDIKIPSTEVTLGSILERMNERIAVLLDKDHCIGHAPFWDIKDSSSEEERWAKIRSVFRNYIAPLLEEYFFDDWEKIALVLNEQSKPEKVKMLKKHVPTMIFGNTTLPEDRAALWTWNEDAFDNPLSYASIYNGDINPQPGEETDTGSVSQL